MATEIPDEMLAELKLHLNDGTCTREMLVNHGLALIAEIERLRAELRHTNEWAAHRICALCPDQSPADDYTVCTCEKPCGWDDCLAIDPDTIEDGGSTDDR